MGQVQGSQLQLKERQAIVHTGLQRFKEALVVLASVFELVPLFACATSNLAHKSAAFANNLDVACFPCVAKLCMLGTTIANVAKLSSTNSTYNLKCSRCDRLCLEVNLSFDQCYGGPARGTQARQRHRWFSVVVQGEECDAMTRVRGTQYNPLNSFDQGCMLCLQPNDVVNVSTLERGLLRQHWKQVFMNQTHAYVSWRATWIRW